MIPDPIHIKFHNSQNPKATFDLLNISDLLSRTDLDHFPYDFHLVEFYMILFIEKGHGKHTIDFKEYDYKKGTILTVRKDQIHKFHQNKNVQGKILIFTDDFLVSYLEKLEAVKTLQLFNEFLSSPKIQLTDPDFKSTKELIYRIENEYLKVNDVYSLSLIRSELHIMITKLFRLKSTSQLTKENRKYLNQFIVFQNLVEAQTERNTMVKEYAKTMGVSTKTLNNITRAIVNKPAKAFVDNVYTKRIKRLLINTEFSIKEIAYTSGFDETTNFYKYFKRQTGQTPEQFRHTNK